MDAATGTKDGLGCHRDWRASGQTYTTVPGLNVYGGFATFTTAQTTYSAATAEYQVAFSQMAAATASNTVITTMLPGLGAGYLATGGSFTFDVPLTLEQFGASWDTTAGNVTVTNPITLNGANTLALRADTGAVAINATINVTDAGGVAISAQLIAGISIERPGVRQWRLDRLREDGTIHGTLSINGQSYTPDLPDRRTSTRSTWSAR